MNWKKFFFCIMSLIMGLTAMALYSFGVIWAADTFGIWWVFGGGMLAFIILISAVFGMTDRDSQI